MSSNDSFAFRRSRLLALGHPGDTRNTSEILDEHRENRAQAAFEASNNFESSSAGARRPTMISVSSSSSDSIPGVGSATGGPNSRPSAGWRAGSSRAASDGVHHSRRFGPSRRTINDEENEVIYAGGSVRGDDGQGTLYSAHFDAPICCSSNLLIHPLSIVLHSLLLSHQFH